MDSILKKHFRLISEVNDAIGSSKDLEEVIDHIFKIISEYLNAKYAVIWLKDNKGLLRPYFSNCPVDLIKKRYKTGEGIVGKVFEDGFGKSIIDFESNPNEEIKELYKGINIKSYHCSLIEDKTGSLGVMEIISDSSNFTDEELEMLELINILSATKIATLGRYKLDWDDKEVLVEIKDVCKTYNTGGFPTKIFENLNLDVYKGEFVVLLGKSGCGKSTLLNIVGGMDTVDSGSIVFNGVDFSNAGEKELTNFRRYNLGFIFQAYNLMPNLTVKENLDLIAELVDDPMDSVEALRLVGLEDKKNHYPSELSGGQQQRVSIARALVKKPALILADEPTAALDYKTSIEVLSVLENVYKNGATIFMVTHNEEIAKMANRIVRVKGGKIHEIISNRNPAKATDLEW
ncbi:MAG: ATP-binding cassette domain-containing protein [Bacilli bacterium]|nr:ATP-binding cassette domain-containing protein [Bacilli bacterium]